MFGGTIERNMANPLEKNIADDVERQEEQAVGERQVVAASSAARPTAVPSIAGGRIFVGTNNDKPRDPKIKGDKGVVMCFGEADGKFLWQIVHDKLQRSRPSTAGEQAIASTPAVDGDRLYYVSNRCELVCADVGWRPRRRPARPRSSGRST